MLLGNEAAELVIANVVQRIAVDVVAEFAADFNAVATDPTANPRRRRDVASQLVQPSRSARPVVRLHEVDVVVVLLQPVWEIAFKK